jgi:hypothetical protein
MADLNHVANGTSHEGLTKPVTYGDVFGASGKIGEEPVTNEDAALMQSAETVTLGKTQKGGAAATMQAAAQLNVSEGLVDKDAHSGVAEQGVSVVEMLIPGEQIDMEFLGEQPVMGAVKPLPTDPLIASGEAVTIGEALEAAAVGAGDKPVQPSDARAIQSAEARATGIPGGIPGGLAASAQSAAELNPRVTASEKTTISDILMDASIDLPVDKVVTQEDASKVLDAELRNSPTGEPQPGGVAAAMQAAADLNERAGLVAPSSIGGRRAFPREDIPAVGNDVENGTSSSPTHTGPEEDLLEAETAEAATIPLPPTPANGTPAAAATGEEEEEATEPLLTKPLKQDVGLEAPEEAPKDIDQEVAAAT